MGAMEIEHYIVSVITFFLMVIVLVMQIQMSKLNKKIEKDESEVHKIVEEVLRKIIKQKTSN
jgi:hypothetical protein